MQLENQITCMLIARDENDTDNEEEPKKQKSFKKRPTSRRPPPLTYTFFDIIMSSRSENI